MRKFENKKLNFIYYFYRLIIPFFDPIRFVKGILSYPRFVKDYINFSRRSDKKLKVRDILPILHEKTEFTTFDGHYYYQQLWVFEEVLKTKPNEHLDIASTYTLSGYISKIVPTTFIDYRPIEARLENLTIESGDILNLAYPSNSVPSLSCLHVIEHIGLGRYGDKIDPDGLIKACKELIRVLAPGGYLYLSTPIGKEVIYFNAHRVTNPNRIVEIFSDLKLIRFDIVDDKGLYKKDASLNDYTDLNYGCGMYIFQK